MTLFTGSDRSLLKGIQLEYRPVFEKLTANSTIIRRKLWSLLKRASNLASNDANSSGSSLCNFETIRTSTTLIVEKIRKIEKLIIDGKVTLVDDDGKPLKKVDYPGGGGLVVLGGRSSSESKKGWGDVGGVEKMRSMGSKFIVGEKPDGTNGVVGRELRGVHGEATCLVYENSKQKKRVMDIKEIPKFCDVTLKRVLEKVKKFNLNVKHGYADPDIRNEDAKYMRFYEEYIIDRLRHRDQMRR
ncbi:hypothetical protein Tco_0278184 [Tanacetum coccineum]